jgi:hypothetical protein
LRAKLTTAGFFIEHLLPSASALLPSIQAGARHIMDMADEDFLRA